MALPNFSSSKPFSAKCANKQCKAKGWFRCRGTCGRGFCGHHARGPIRHDDTRAPEAQRGTCICRTCQP